MLLLLLLTCSCLLQIGTSPNIPDYAFPKITGLPFGKDSYQYMAIEVRPGSTAPVCLPLALINAVAFNGECGCQMSNVVCQLCMYGMY
jgi:hypothetical protein